jgi:dienelactone hydrolase
MGRAGADVEIHRYAGAGHLYTDPDLPDYDEKAAEATWRVALGFLESL